MKKLITFSIFILAVLFLFVGCPSKIDEESTEEQNPGDISIQPPDAPTETILDGFSVIVNDSNYSVEQGAIGYSSEYSDYVYGIIKIKYLGSEDRISIQVDVVFEDENSNRLFTDWSYIWNPKMCKYTSIDYNTSSFFTPTYNTGYYFIIEDLSYYNINLSDISKVYLTITSSSYSYIPPLGRLEKIGNYYQDDYCWNVNIKNTGEIPVQQMFSQFIYDNGYMWGFPLSYRLVGSNYVYDDIFYVGETGRLQDWGGYNNLNVIELLLDWDVYDETTTTLNLLKKLNLEDLSIDEINKLMRDTLDSVEKNKQKNQ